MYYYLIYLQQSETKCTSIRFPVGMLESKNSEYNIGTNIDINISYAQNEEFN
jgi:hypothetical protein